MSLFSFLKNQKQACYHMWLHWLCMTEDHQGLEVPFAWSTPAITTVLCFYQNRLPAIIFCWPNYLLVKIFHVFYLHKFDKKIYLNSELFPNYVIQLGRSYLYIVIQYNHSCIRNLHTVCMALFIPLAIFYDFTYFVIVVYYCYWQRVLLSIPWNKHWQLVDHACIYW